jgi:hypothetical protein
MFKIQILCIKISEITFYFNKIQHYLMKMLNIVYIKQI